MGVYPLTVDSFDELDGPPVPPPLLQQQLHCPPVATGRGEEHRKPPRDVHVKLSVTETDFVVVEDMRQLSSNAVVLKV